MRVEDAAAAVAFLTAMCSGYNDDTTEQLVYEFEKLDDPVALATAVQKVARSWTSQGRVPLGVIHDAYHHEIRLQIAAAQDDDESARCDGWGWLEGLPCPSCSPALRQVYADPEKLRRWRDGVPTYKLLGFEKRPAFEEQWNRERCPKTVDDGPGPLLTADEARQREVF